MKHQQVIIDYWLMLKTSVIYLALAFSGYILLKLLQTIIYLPQYLANNQRHMEELTAKSELISEDNSTNGKTKSKSNSKQQDNLPHNIQKHIKKTK